MTPSLTETIYTIEQRLERLEGARDDREQKMPKPIVIAPTRRQAKVHADELAKWFGATRSPIHTCIYPEELQGLDPDTPLFVLQREQLADDMQRAIADHIAFRSHQSVELELL